MSSNYPQLKIAARASLAALFIFIFVFPSVFSVLIPSEARAATTISKSLSRPVNNLGLVGWWTMDGPDTLTNIADKSGQGNNGSLSHGGSGTTTAPGRVGQALSFDGTNDFASTTNTNFPDTSSSDYTVAVWVKPSSIPGGSNPRIFVYATDATNGIKLAFGGANCTANFIFEPKKAGINYGGCGTTTTFSVNTWYHLVGVFKSSTNTVTFYVNNTVQTTSAFAGGLPSTTGVGYIGVSNAASFFPGSLDDLRLYNRALSAAEITRLYQIGATSKIAKTLPGRDSLTSGLVGWWTFDGPDMLTNVADKSGQGNNGSLSHGGSGTTTAPGRVGQALSFDGVNDIVSVPHSSSLNFNGLSFSGFAWVKPTDIVGSTFPTVFSKRPGDDPQSITFFYDYASAGSKGGYMDVILNISGIRKDCETDIGEDVDDNIWSHIGFTYDGTNVIIYKDGVAIQTCNYAGSLVTDTTNFSIGKDNVAPYVAKGSIDDLRLYNRALSAAEVLRLYQIGATSKIAKTLPGRDSLTSGLVGWWTMDGPDTLTNVADKSGQGNNGSLIHGGSGTTTAPGRVGQALSFDGSNDYVNAGSGSSLDNLGPLTYSAWINPKSYGSSTFGGAIIISKAKRLLHISDVKSPSIPLTLRMFISASTNGQPYCNNLGFSYNKWQHVAVAWDGVLPFTGKFYIDGVACITGADNLGSGTITSDATDIQYIGSDFSRSNGYFQGDIDDVRFYNRALSAAEVLQLYNIGR